MKRIVVEKDQLHDMYLVQDMSASKIANHLECSQKTISRYLRKYGIPTKRRPKQDLKADLSFVTFGRLTVTNFSHRKNGSYYWKCSCKCGGETTTSARSLLRKDHGARSCGCMYRGIDWQIVPPYYWSSIKCKASYRDIPFSIDREYGESVFKEQEHKCALTGIDISFSRRFERQETTASLDRIDSSGGYQEGNVQWVHKDINKMKTDFNQDEFVKYCKLVAEHV